MTNVFIKTILFSTLVLFCAFKTLVYADSYDDMARAERAIKQFEDNENAKMDAARERLNRNSTPPSDPTTSYLCCAAILVIAYFMLKAGNPQKNKEDETKLAEIKNENTEIKIDNLKTPHDLTYALLHSEVTNNFSATHEFITKDGSAFIQVDEQRSIIRLGTRNPDRKSLVTRTVNVSTILGVQLTEDGNDMRAGNNSKTVSNISLVLALDDLSTPYASLNFMTKETNRGSQEQIDAREEAQKWAGVINILLVRHGRDNFIANAIKDSEAP